MSNKTHLKEPFLKVLSNKLGVVSAACTAVGISRVTYYDWCKKDPEFKEKAELIQEDVIDFVESQLFININNGNVPSIIFYLKTKGRNRGYVESTIIKREDSDLKTMTDRELDEEIARLDKANDC